MMSWLTDRDLLVVLLITGQRRRGGGATPADCGCFAIGGARYLFVGATVVKAARCPSTGSATTIKSQSSSSLGLRSFMPGCVLRLPTLADLTDQTASR
jgi:hypothetical protein